MKFTKPQLIPTLLCLLGVGLVAATLPHPNLGSNLTVISPEKSAETASTVQGDLNPNRLRDN